MHRGRLHRVGLRHTQGPASHCALLYRLASAQVLRRGWAAACRAGRARRHAGAGARVHGAQRPTPGSGRHRSQSCFFNREVGGRRWAGTRWWPRCGGAWSGWCWSTPAARTRSACRRSSCPSWRRARRAHSRTARRSRDGPAAAAPRRAGLLLRRQGAQPRRRPVQNRVPRRGEGRVSAGPRRPRAERSLWRKCAQPRCCSVKPEYCLSPLCAHPLCPGVLTL